MEVPRISLLTPTPPLRHRTARRMIGYSLSWDPPARAHTPGRAQSEHIDWARIKIQVVPTVKLRDSPMQILRPPRPYKLLARRAPGNVGNTHKEPRPLTMFTLVEIRLDVTEVKRFTPGCLARTSSTSCVPHMCSKSGSSLAVPSINPFIRKHAYDLAPLQP